MRVVVQWFSPGWYQLAQQGFLQSGPQVFAWLAQSGHISAIFLAQSAQQGLPGSQLGHSKVLFAWLQALSPHSPPQVPQHASLSPQVPPSRHWVLEQPMSIADAATRPISANFFFMVQLRSRGSVR
jgi:hypothetical protein